MTNLKDIEIQKDLSSTRIFYKKFSPNSDSDICECEECKNFRTYKKAFLSKEFKDFLEYLGVDPFFDLELWSYELESEGKVCYYYNYYFYGHIADENQIENKSFDQILPYNVSFSISRESANFYKISVFAKLPWNLSDNKLPKLEYEIKEFKDSVIILKYLDDERLKPIRISLMNAGIAKYLEPIYSDKTGTCEIEINEYLDSDFIRIETNLTTNHKSLYIPIKKNGI